MWQLFQFPLCPFSRKVRLVLAEKGVGHELVRENPWEKRDEFIDLNPAGETPVMVEPDQGVTLIYQAEGLHLTVLGKSLENGTEGDVVNVMNLQSKRTVSGTVTGRGQVSITPVAPRPPQTSDATSSLGATQPAPVAVATVSSSVAPKAE